MRIFFCFIPVSWCLSFARWRSCQPGRMWRPTISTTYLSSWGWGSCFFNLLLFDFDLPLRPHHPANKRDIFMASPAHALWPVSTTHFKCSLTAIQSVNIYPLISLLCSIFSCFLPSSWSTSKQLFLIKIVDSYNTILRDGGIFQISSLLFIILLLVVHQFRLIFFLHCCLNSFT